MSLERDEPSNDCDEPPTWTNPPLTRTTLGQLCSILWDSQSQPVVTQPRIEPGSVVTPLALRCTREAQYTIVFSIENVYVKSISNSV